MEGMKEAVDYVIFGILGLMGFVALWFSIERVLFLRRYQPEHYLTEEERSIALTKNFTTLYIIYSNAPYVGLLGTVIGIQRFATRDECCRATKSNLKGAL